MKRTVTLTIDRGNAVTIADRMDGNISMDLDAACSLLTPEEAFRVARYLQGAARLASGVRKAAMRRKG